MYFFDEGYRNGCKKTDDSPESGLPNVGYDFFLSTRNRTCACHGLFDRRGEERRLLGMGQPQSPNTLDLNQVGSPDHSYGFFSSPDTDQESSADCIIQEKVGSCDYVSSEGSDLHGKVKESEEKVVAKYETEPGYMTVEGEPESPQAKRLNGEVIKREECCETKKVKEANDAEGYRSKIKRRRMSE